ncbi:MAG: ABC transporter permease [Methanomassiliicoccus sp.]|nr:ABC transporter permease [Methanomassiliicoccus sp.]
MRSGHRIWINFVAQAKMFFRSIGSVFWTVAFPVLLILLFGAIFSGSGSATYTLYVQDLDSSEASAMYIHGLNETKVLNLIMVGPEVDATSYIKDNSIATFLIIPEGFHNAFAPEPFQQNTSVELRMDNSSSSAMAVASVVNAVTQSVNLGLANGSMLISTDLQGISANNQYTYIDFFLPGVIGLTAMTSTVNWMVGLQTRYRSNGIFKKLATTPITQLEWLVSLMIWQVITVFMSVAIILIVGILAFDVHLTLDLLSIAIIILTSAMFSALGLIIARFVKEEETAGAAAGAITFPMMFLGGSFFPLESMPDYLQAIAKVMPLTYVNNGLRDAMIYGNSSGAFYNLMIVAVLTAVFVIVGVAISTWKQD